VAKKEFLYGESTDELSVDEGAEDSLHWGW
jgi:hypothetical protein